MMRAENSEVEGLRGLRGRKGWDMAVLRILPSLGQLARGWARARGRGGGGGCCELATHAQTDNSNYGQIIFVHIGRPYHHSWSCPASIRLSSLMLTMISSLYDLTSAQYTAQS